MTTPREHYATRLKRELADANETIAFLRERLSESPEVPVYATLYQGQGCLNFADRGNERRRSLSGCMDVVEVLYRANGAPVFDISNLSMSDLCRIGDLPLNERVAALDAVFCPRINRYAATA